MVLAQTMSVIIFIVMFGLIISDTIERHIVSLGCGLATLVLVFGLIMRDGGAVWRALSFDSFRQASFWYSAGNSAETSVGINWATILFIAGMMVMVEGMSRAGFFRWLCLRMAKAVHYKVSALFVAFMIMSSVLAMFIDSITVILFLAAATVELSKLLKFDPVPLIISEIFCSNLGGSATMCGDPPNIIIGTSLGYSFADFVKNTGVIALVSLAFVILFFYFSFRKELVPAVSGEVKYPDPREAITDKRRFTVSTVIFLIAVALLVSHAQTGLTVATIGCFIAALTLLTAGKDAIDILRKIDYKTLSFFVGLFVVVAGLETTGILDIIAAFIARISGSHAMVTVAVVLWISAIASAFVDNIPFAATMVPVIRTLSTATGCPLDVLAWSLAIGTDIGGNGTPIGASANVVGISVAAKNGHMIGWGKYCRYAAPATIIVVTISMLCLFVRYF